jgi:D-methionine transport system substrate-binding protein
MKHGLVWSALLGLCLAFCPVANGTARAAEKIIRAGFCPGPYASLFYAAIRPGLEDKGYRIEFKEYPDYVKPNLALAGNEIDCNLFQHSAYLENFKKQQNVDQSAVAAVPTISMGVYSLSLPSLDNIPDGAKVAMPGDPANLARALRVLSAAKLVDMAPEADPAAYTQANIGDNPHNLKIVPMDADKVADALQEVDLAVVNGNFALYAGLSMSRMLYAESLAPNMFNVIAIRTSSKGTDLEKDLIAVLTSDAYNAIISDPLRLYSLFQKPAEQLFK